MDTGKELLLVKTVSEEVSFKTRFEGKERRAMKGWKEENSWSVHQETEGKTTKLFWTILEKSGEKKKKKAARKKRS